VRIEISCAEALALAGVARAAHDTQIVARLPTTERADYLAGLAVLERAAADFLAFGKRAVGNWPGASG
jgi:hypothetical protein